MNSTPRRPKFRAWDTQEHKWYKPILEAYKGNLFELMVSFSGDLLAHVPASVEHESLWPDRYILVQYTGLHDKTGREIYEGDIVRNGWDSKNISPVTYSGIGFSVDFGYIETMEEQFDDCEIIGNIYENPELLENSK